MQNAEPKRRCSILKKRRSRSLSPKPLAEPNPRRSRRISFSGKNAVREFIGASENKETIWVASYEESTDNHQFSINQAIASSTMHSTKNDTISMQIDMDIDCSNISFNQPQQPPKQSLIPRPSNANHEQTVKTIVVSQQSTAVVEITNDDPDSKKSKLSMFQKLLKLQEEQQLQQTQQLQQEKQETQQMPVPRVFQNKVDMEMSVVASEQHKTNRRTIAKSCDISMDNSLDVPKSGDVKNNGAVSRPTNRNTVFDAKNMSLDHNQSITGSFDLNKTNQHTADMSIMLERKPIRDTAIFKSPQKKGAAKLLEKTVVFDADIEETHVIMGTRNISNYPIQIEGPKRNLSTLMDSIAMVSVQPMEKQLNETVNDAMEMDESFVQKTETMPLAKPSTIFNQNKCTTIYESVPVEMSLTKPIPAKNTSLDLLPMLSHANKENDPRIIDMLNIDAAAAANADMSLDNTWKSESAIIENVFETKSVVRRTIFDQNSLEMSDASVDPKPVKRVNLNKTPFVSENAFGRKGSLDLNESIDINDTFKMDAPQSMPNNIVRIDQKRKTIHYNEPLELSNMSFDMRNSMLAESTGKIPQVADQSKNMSLDLDDTTLVDNFSMPPQATNALLNKIKRATTFANQSIDLSDNSMEQTHLNPAKKFNPNKTPFYFNEEKQSELEMSNASNSSIMNLDNTLQKRGIQLAPNNADNFEMTLQHHTELFDQTISGSENGADNISIHADTSVNAAVVISDSSNMNISVDAPIQGKQNRASCYEHVSMVQEKARKNRGTIYKNESMLLESIIMDQSNIKMDSCCYLTDIGETDTPSEKSKSSIVAVIDTSLEPSKLSFYEDEGDENEGDDDYLCNTKPQLIESYENVSNEYVARDLTMASKQSFEHVPGHIIDSYRSEIPVEDELYETKQSISEQPPKILNMNEHDIFKKSTLLRRSGAHEMGPSMDGSDDDNNEQHSETNQMEINNASVIVENQQEIFKRPKPLPKMPRKTDGMGTEQPSTSKQAIDHEPSTSNRSHIQRPSIIRRSINSDGPLDETSFLMNMSGDKPASELNVDFSGYQKFEGLATIEDVLRNHQLRRKELARRVERWNYQLEHNLPMEGIDNDDEDSPEDVESQNVEAPSWTFLWHNKIKWEIEQMKLEVQQEFEERPPGAFLPVAPDISILILNKCKQLKNWNFDELWYFKGNIRLRSIALPAFSIIILYDPDIEAINRNVDMYGGLKFVKIVTEYCPKMCSIQSPCLHLKLRELRNLLPLNLTLMCDNSSDLSAFDEKLNGFVMATIARIEHLKEICDKNNALLKMEDGVVYIRKTMFCRRVREFQDYIIELNGIDTTDWHDVRTKPHRVLNEEVKALQKGMPFLEQFLANDKMYVPIVSTD